MANFQLRALRKADVVLHDAGVAPAILDYARRDARQLALDAEDADLTGLHVVVLHSPRAAPLAVAGGAR